MDIALSTKLISIGFLTLCSAALLTAAARSLLEGKQRDTQISYVLPLLQFFVGVALLIPALHPWSKFSAGVPFVIFGAFQALALIRGKGSAYGFWDGFSSSQISWAHVARNWVIAALLIFAVPSSAAMYLSENSSSTVALAVAVAIVYLFMATRNLKTPHTKPSLLPAA